MLAKDGLRLLVELAERDSLEAIGALQAKVEAADASEKGKDAELAHENHPTKGAPAARKCSSSVSGLR